MIATITNRSGDIVFSAVCSIRQDEFSDAERQEFARLMGEVDALIVGALRRREVRGAPLSLAPAEAGPLTAELLRDYRSKNGA